jgi:hypothetical protein
MKPPKKCMKIDQVLNSLFESETSDSISDALSKTGSDSDSFEEKKSSKRCFRKSNSFQFDKGNNLIKSTEHDQLKQIEDILKIKPIESNNLTDTIAVSTDDDDDDDEIPLGKLVCIKNSIVAKENKKQSPFKSNKTNKKQLSEIEEADNEEETDTDNDDDEEDDTPLFKLISTRKSSSNGYKNDKTKMKDSDETDEEVLSSDACKKKVFAERTNIIRINNPNISKKLRRLCKAKSMKNENSNHSSFLKGLYDFDCIEETMSDEASSDIENLLKNQKNSKVEDISLDVIDKTTIATNSPEQTTLKSPIIPLNPSEYFVLSLKNLKRKKSSKLLSNISKNLF